MSDYECSICGSKVVTHWCQQEVRKLRQQLQEKDAEIARLKEAVKRYEKNGVTCQTYGHVVGACAECNTHEEAVFYAKDVAKLVAQARHDALMDKVERFHDSYCTFDGEYEDSIQELITRLAQEELK